jgi:DnaJ-class molecular chaperone
MDFKDYYATLGVAKTATDKEIKQAFRKLARKYHPDVNPGDKAAETRFKEINEAHEVLSDPEKRRKYDELGANWRAYEQGGAGGQTPPGFDQFWQTGGRGGAQYRTVTPEEMEEIFGSGGAAGDHPFSDFFRTFFGGGGGPEGGRTGHARTSRGRARTRAGSDVEHPVQLTLEEAFSGTLRRLSLKHDGHTRTIDVRIPAGVRDNARVRVSGEGEPGTGGARAGDLYLRVQVMPHHQFERQGDDLTTKVSVALTTAVLGGEAAVPTIGGGTVRLKVPPTTQNGQRFRLKGQGMPIAGKQERGDLYVTVDVQLPRTLSADAREHYEALARLGEA